ncbi:unnamed protein product, partial [Prorocentrum cordatum]
ADELVTYGEGVTKELLRVIAPTQRVEDTEQYADAVPGVLDFSYAEQFEKTVKEKLHDGFDIRAVVQKCSQDTEPFDEEGGDGDGIEESMDEQVVQFDAERAAEPPNQEATEASEKTQEDPVQIGQAVEKLQDGFNSQAEVQKQFLGTEPFDQVGPHDDGIEVDSEVVQEQLGTTSWKCRAGENWLSFDNQSAEIEKAHTNSVR